VAQAVRISSQRTGFDSRAVHVQFVHSFKYNQQDATLYNIFKLYMFRAVSPPIIRSSRNAHTESGICQAWYIPDTVCTVLELLMMGGETARNMYSLTIIKKYCITLHLVGCN
jgi:hypothetical protein